MQKLGLTNAERSAFHRALRSSHTRRVYITVTDLDGNVVSTLNNRVLDGQVTVDYDAEVSRSLNLSLLDPTHSLNFDTDSPDDGALFADRMIRVHLSVLVDELGRRVSVPVFHGPVTKLDRKGDVVDIEAQGKEALANGAIWRPTTYKKGAHITDVIRAVLRDRSGETRFSIPDLPFRLRDALSLNRYDSPWRAARRLAKSIDRHLFYDGAGVATLRHLPQRPVWTFTQGTGGDIVSEVEVAYAMEDLKNTVVVIGGKPKGAKEKVRGQAIAPPLHPLSPRRLGRRKRDGELIERHLAELIEDDKIRSKKDADAKAKRVLDDRLRSVVEVTFDTLPIPHLEPGDLVAVKTDEMHVEFRLKQFTIPLGVSGAPVMSVGYHKKTTVNRRRIRRR